MKNYYAIIDYSETINSLRPSEITNMFSYVFNFNKPTDALLTLNDEGSFDCILPESFLKTDIVSGCYCYDFFKNLNIGRVSSIYDLNYLNNYLEKRSKDNFRDKHSLFNFEKEPYNLFCLFDLDNADCSFVSLEFLTSYFMETFEDIDIKILKRVRIPRFKDFNYKYLTLAKVEFDEDIFINLKDRESDYIINNPEVLKYKEMKEMFKTMLKADGVLS